MANKPEINNLFNIFEGMNAFGAGPDARTKSLLDSEFITPETVEAANRRSIGTGIVTGLANYLAMPKNQGFGSGIPYIAQSYLAANKAAQAPFQRIGDKYAMDTQIAEQKRVLEQRGKRALGIDQFILNNPNMEHIRNLDDATQDKIIAESAKIKMTPKKPLAFNMQQFNDTVSYLQQQEPDADLQTIKNKAYKIIAEANKNNTTINMPGQDVINKDLGTLFVDTMNVGVSAAGNLTNLARMENLLANANQGLQQGNFTDAKALGKRFGFEVDETELDSEQAARALSNKLAIALRPKSSGVMTDKDFKVFLESVPGIQNTAGANKLMIEFARDSANRQIKLSKMMREYKAGTVDAYGRPKKRGAMDDGAYEMVAKYWEGVAQERVEMGLIARGEKLGEPTIREQ